MTNSAEGYTGVMHCSFNQLAFILHVLWRQFNQLNYHVYGVGDDGGDDVVVRDHVNNSEQEHFKDLQRHFMAIEYRFIERVTVICKK